MHRLLLVGICVFFVSLTLSGCFGLAIRSPAECENETPYTGVRDIFGKPHGNVTKAVLPPASTKADFLREWGQPDTIVADLENNETWTYERRLWCGAIPMVFVPIPLVLPVCDGFDRIYFVGNQAKRLHTRHACMAAFFVFLTPAGGTGGAEVDAPCRYPIPFDSKTNAKPHKEPPISAQSCVKGYNVPENSGLIVLYRPDVFLGSAGIHTAHVGENLLVPLYNGSYYPHLSPLGEKELWVDSSYGKKTVKINVKSGQRYFIRFRLGVFTIYFEEVPAEVAAREIIGLNLISSP